jgi:hypothetical protein
MARDERGGDTVDSHRCGLLSWCRAEAAGARSLLARRFSQRPRRIKIAQELGDIDFPVPRGPRRKKDPAGGAKIRVIDSIMRRIVELLIP